MHLLQISHHKNVIIVGYDKIFSNVQFIYNRPSIKPGTRNIAEHPGRSNNYHNYEKKISKIKFSKVNLKKNKLISARKMKN